MIPISDRQVAIVDAGEDQAGEAFLRELLRRQMGPDAVATILLARGHPDHTGAIRQFQQAQLIALGAEVPLAEGSAEPHGWQRRVLRQRPLADRLCPRKRVEI